METDSSSELSNEEEEIDVKISVRVEPCLLCAQPAVTYDWDGNVIKREPLSSEVGKWSNEQLFSFLCQSFGLDNERRSKNEWKLRLNPLPFCDVCEQLINSLADVYSKLEELKTVLRVKIEGAEEVYSVQKLYEKHDKAYLEFRKDILGDKFIDPSNEDASPSSHEKLGKRRMSKRKVKAKKKLKLEEHTPVQVTRQLRKRPMRQQYDERSSSSNEEDEQESIATSPVPSAPDLDDISGDSSISNEEDKQPCRKKKVQPERKRREFEKVSVAIDKKRKRNLQKSTFRTSNHGFMERDEKTGSITYSTGFGNRFKSMRTTLIFNQVEKDGGKLEYECSSCSSCFPVFTCTRRQQKLFRQHFLSRHSDHYSCRLCLQPVKHSSKDELLEHIKTVHSIDSLDVYARRCSSLKFARYSFANKRRNLAVEGEFGPAAKDQIGLKCCEVCAMPFGDLRSKSYLIHMRTHMSDEDKQERAKYKGRKPKEMVTAPSEEQLSSGLVNQCQTCGKFITNGEPGLLRHIQEFHESSSSSAAKKPFVCSICGVSYSTKQALARHMEKLHPNGEWEGPFNCKYPGCAQNLDTELNLKAHVQYSHEQSAEEKKQVLCFSCGKVLSSKQGLQQHELVHLGKKPHVCQICGKKCTVKDTLKLHMATNHGIGTETWKCEEKGCGKVFPNRKFFQAHRRIQHGVALRKCKNDPTQGAN